MEWNRFYYYRYSTLINKEILTWKGIKYINSYFNTVIEVCSYTWTTSKLFQSISRKFYWIYILKKNYLSIECHLALTLKIFHYDDILIRMYNFFLRNNDLYNKYMLKNIFLEHVHRDALTFFIYSTFETKLRIPAS